MSWLDRLQQGPGRMTLGEGSVELFHWAYSPQLPDNVPHRHTYFEICQVGAYGAGRFIVEGADHPLQPGDLFIARPGVIHQIVNTAVPQMELYWVAFQWLPDAGKEGEISRLMDAFARSPLLVLPDEDARTAVLWTALRTVCDGPCRPGYELQVEGLVASLLLAIAQAGSGMETPPTLQTGDVEHAAARMAVRYIHDNLERTLTIREIADHVCLSPRHFCRLFRQFTGASPVAYLTQSRMDRAQGLLLHTSDSIREIAGAVGYEDVHYFTRVFTRCFHQPPGSFRRQRGEGHVPKIQKIGALV